MKHFFLIILSVFLLSCSPKLTNDIVNHKDALGYGSGVTFLGEDADDPGSAEYIGTLSIDRGTMQTRALGTYDKSLEFLGYEARKMGGNVVKITRHIEPDAFCVVHRFDTKVFYTSHPETVGGTLLDASEMDKEHINSALEIDIHGGYATRLGEVGVNQSVKYPDYYTDRLLQGVSFGADIIWYFKKYFGIGIRYNDFRTSTRLSEQECLDYNGHFSKMYDKEYVIFVGPVASFRYIRPYSRSMFSGTFGFGAINYKDKGYDTYMDYRVKALTYGWTGSVKYSYRITNILSVGAFCNYTGGPALERYYHYTNAHSNMLMMPSVPESVSTISYGLGVQFTL